MKPITYQQKKWVGTVLNGFLRLVKMSVVVLLILAGVLVASQSAVSPVSTRLVGMYALEYSVRKIKPYRPFFPRPYKANLENYKR